MKILGLLSMCAALLAQKPPPIPAETSPKEVRDFVRSAAEALQNKDVQAFLDRCDGKMPGYEMLHYYLEGLAARENVLSSIEIPEDKLDPQSDGQRHSLILDWTLNIDSEPLRRAAIKANVEKQGKKWKFTSLDPIDFFKPPAQ